MIDQKKQDELKDLFKLYPQIIAVYLYGSQVGGYASKKSDLDLAAIVDVPVSIDYGDLYLKVSQIIKGKEIDLRIITKQTSPTFIFQVIKSNRCIYKRSDKEKVLFESRAISEYYDGQHVREIYDSYLKPFFERRKL